MISSSLHKNLSFDEYPNLHYGYRVLTEGPSAVPDGQRPILMALNALPCYAYGCDPNVFGPSELRRLWIRFPTMLFALLLGGLIFKWSKELYGPWAAGLALALYAFNPNFIAHGKQVTSDVATSFFILWSLYRFYHFLKNNSWWNLLGVAGATSAAILAKYSSLILPLIYVILAILKRWATKKDLPSARVSFRPVILKLMFFIFTVLFFINIAYLFQGSFSPAKQYAWQSASFQKKFSSSSLPLPLPKAFVLGLDYTSYIQEHPEIGRGSNYILGKLHRKGRWYSFPIMLLLKTPLPFFIFLILARFRRQTAWFDTACLWIPFGLWLLIFSLACHAQLGIRYILPALVFLFLDAGRVLSGEGLKKSKVWIVAGLLIGYAASSLSYFPHFMSYFNETIGPRINAYKYLADSNLEWEDQSYTIQKFMDQNPSIHFEFEPKHPVSGHLIVGANAFVGVIDEQRYKWLRDHFHPLRHIGYSHFLFYVAPETLAAAVTADNHE